MLTHQHADGGYYAFICEANGKGDEPGVDWVPGVIYKGEDGEFRWTSKARWDDRFTPLEIIPVSTSQITFTDEDEVIASYVVRVDDIGGARMMTTSAADMASKGKLSHVEMVLRAHAESMTEGLHVRDVEFPDLIGDVAAFHAKYKQHDEHYGNARILPRDLHDFRICFHEEETKEYRDEYELLVRAAEEGKHEIVVDCLDTQLDSLVDAAWVLLGTADLQFGPARFKEAWRRVVEKNMQKVLATEDPDAQDSGREVKYDVRKPVGWEAPCHKDLVADYLRHDGVMCVAAPINDDIEFQGFNQDAAE